MKQFTLNKKEYNLPENWEDLTLIQYCNAFFQVKEYEEDPNLSKEENDVALIRHTRQNESIIISRLMGEDDEWAMDLPIEIYSYLQNSLAFIFDIKEFVTGDLHFHLTVDGIDYTLTDIKEMPLRQYIDVEEVLKDNDNPTRFCDLLAIILKNVEKEEKYNGSYEEMSHKLQNIPAKDGLPFIYTLLKKKVILLNAIQASTTLEEIQNLLPQNISNS